MKFLKETSDQKVCLIWSDAADEEINGLVVGCHMSDVLQLQLSEKKTSIIKCDSLHVTL